MDQKFAEPKHTIKKKICMSLIVCVCVCMITVLFMNCTCNSLLYPHSSKRGNSGDNAFHIVCSKE